MRGATSRRWVALLALAAGLFLSPAVRSAPLRGPVVSDVMIQGNRLVPTEEVRGLLKTRPGLEYTPEMVLEDVRTLYKSRKFANVYAEKQDAGPGQVKVLFVVRDYPSVVEKVEYRGAKHLSAEKLNEVTSIRKGTPCNPLINRAACRRIEARYHEEGRPFTTCALLKGGEPGDTEVIFTIVEGPKVKVKAIHFTGNIFVSGAVLKTHISSSAGLLGFGLIGGSYVPAVAEADVVEVVKYYRSLGFQDVRVAREVRYSPDSSGVTLLFHIHEGPRYRVKDRPTIRGVNFKRVPAELLGFCKVRAGEYYNEWKINADLAVIRDYFGYRGHDVRARVVPLYSPSMPGIVGVRYEVEEINPIPVRRSGTVGAPASVIRGQIPAAALPTESGSGPR
jgi:outer membrane protein insertion porin family